MSCTFLRPVVALLTFTIGVTLSSSGLRHHRPVLKPATVVEPAASRPSESQPLSFSSRMHACGPQANYHTYESSDGVFISEANERYPSARRANLELQKRIHSATEIIERSPELDERGRRVGEKVVAMIDGDAYVLRVNGNWLHSTQSSSLRHVLEFEKR